MCEANLGCTGERRLAVVGTQTDWGLRVEFGVTTQNWPQLHFGYQRREMTYFPVQSGTNPDDPKAGDHFPSALAMVSTGYNVPTTRLAENGGAPEVGFGTAQMIATGAAADYLAERAGDRQRGARADAGGGEFERGATARRRKPGLDRRRATASGERGAGEAGGAKHHGGCRRHGGRAARAADLQTSQIDMEVGVLMRNYGLGATGDEVKIRDQSPATVEMVNGEIMKLGGETIDAHATVGVLRQRLKSDATLRGALLASAGVDISG